MICDGLKYSAQTPAKNTHAVIERLYDNRSANSVEAERKLVDSICNAAKIAHPVDVWRHNSKRMRDTASQLPQRPRPLKVQFASVRERDDFLYYFNDCLPAWRSLFPGQRPTVRRDMTQPELQLLYKLRKMCYSMNQDAGLIKFVVRDLSISQLKVPRSFPKPVVTEPLVNDASNVDK